MPYESTVYRILIASPSDVDEEREMVSRIIQDWNDLNSYNKKIVLLPIRWETHSSPTYGVRPQEAINKQIVDDCDLLIGFFWTKIGTPTGESLSGTIEEIKKVSSLGKPVMLYFSKRGKDPSQIDIAQLNALNNFKNDVFKIALVESYNSIVDFRDKLSRQLEMKIRELQERKESSEDLVTFSFVDKMNGELLKRNISVNIERVEANLEKMNELIKTDNRLEKIAWEFNRSVKSYLNKKNNIPIILGLRNNGHRIIGNILSELRINSSIENNLSIRSIGTMDDGHIYGMLDEYDLTRENVEVIRKLFKDSLIQTSDKIWEYSSKPFTLLPNKTKVLEPVIILYPKESQNIQFSFIMFSENILQSIESKCELEIICKTRELTDKEIEEIISSELAVDDLPF